MENYILEINKKEICLLYGDKAPVMIHGNIKKYTKDGFGVQLLYVCVKRNIEEPVFVITDECEMINGEICKEKSKKYNINGKCIGISDDFKICDGGVICNEINWLGKPLNKKDVLKQCKGEKNERVC